MTIAPEKDLSDNENAIPVSTGVPKTPARSREKRGHGRIAKAALLVGLGVAGGAAAGVALTHDHDVQREKALEAQTDLSLRLGNIGIKQIFGFSTDKNGNTLVILSTDPGKADNQHLHFEVVEHPKLELIDGEKESTTGQELGKPYVVFDHASEETALQGLEARN